MRKVIHIIFVISFLFLEVDSQLSAQEIDKEQAFYTYMKVYKLDPNSGRGSWYATNNPNDKCGNTYQLYYANTFDQYNLQQNRNDEFSRNKYWTNINKKMIQQINNVDLKNKFSIIQKAHLGEYSFSEKLFPIQTTLVDYPFYFDGDCYFAIRIGNVINSNAFGLYLKMSDDNAERFIKRRKDSNGNINRTLYAKITFSIVNKQISRRSSNMSGNNLVAYVYSIELFESDMLTNRLSIIYPNVDYYDKVNGVKIKDGTETIYYNTNWKICTKEEAKYYKIINYANGKISGPVRDYFISGKLQMEGTYIDYAEDGYGNGLFTWFYENGQKSVEVNYTNGKRNGKYTSWYLNGGKKEEVNFVDGEMKGEHLEWKESKNNIK